MKGPGLTSKMAPKDRLLREERLPAAVIVLVGVWLIVAPFVLEYSHTLAGSAGYWNDAVSGAVVAVVALCCLLMPRVASRLGLIDVVIGFWLIVAPFVLGYPAAGHRDLARANDIFAGIVIALFSAVCVTVAHRRGRSGAYRSVSRGAP